MDEIMKPPPEQEILATAPAPDSMERGIFWIPVGIFVLYTALNMLDRQLLAAVAPTLMEEFQLNNAQYGAVVSSFYAIATFGAPLAGLFIDKVGLRIGASIAIGIWSISGALTGLTSSLRGLMACRLGLGLGESGGGASPGAVLARYMSPAQLGVGQALLASGTSIGAIAAPLVVAAMAPAYGWRSVFIVTGVLGLLWVPLWLLTSKAIPPRFERTKQNSMPLRQLLRDRRLWAVVAAYALSRQTLWVQWTTLYFTEQRGLTMVEANQRFSWYPSVFGALGAFTIGALVMYWVRKGTPGLTARLRACLWCSPFLLITASLPLVGSTNLAAILVGLSFFFSVCVWTSIHLLPIDLWGVGRAAFTYAILECAFTGGQTFASPAVGALVDAYGFNVVCVIMPVFPLLAVAILWASFRNHRSLGSGSVEI